MPRIRIVAVLAVVASLVLAGAAIAATKVTGGTTQLTASSAAVTVLTTNHITVTPVAPATASGTTLTFPISGGHVDTKTLFGFIRHKGGVTLSNGTKSYTLRDLTIVSNKAGAFIYALVRNGSKKECTSSGAHHLHVTCRTVIHFGTERIGELTNASQSGGKVTATVKLTRFSANLVNKLAGKTVASAGDVLGTATIAPTLK